MRRGGGEERDGARMRAGGRMCVCGLANHVLHLSVGVDVAELCVSLPHPEAVKAVAGWL